MRKEARIENQVTVEQIHGYHYGEHNKKAVFISDRATQTDSNYRLPDGTLPIINPDDLDGYCNVYCHGWKDEEIKQEIADVLGDGDPSHVVLFKYTGEMRWVDSYEIV